MKLADLAARLSVLSRTGGGNPELSGVSHDSRAVRPGWIFVGVPGLKQNGMAFAEQAIANGAAAIIGEDAAPAEIAVPYLQVAHARQALALSAWTMAGNPERALELFAVTGTNGKTTIATTLSYALNSLHIPCAVCGTLGISFLDTHHPGSRTTPEASYLAPALSEMSTRGVKACVMEATSIGIALDRIFGLPFRFAIFTNLSRDHLDFHGSWGAYLSAKLRLFRELPQESVAIINADDPVAAEFFKASPGRVITYGIDNPADFQATRIELRHSELNFTVRERENDYEVTAPMIGRFNIYNLLAVVATLRARGIPTQDIAVCLKNAPGVRGRAEVVKSSAPFTVLVDYAHTPDALEKILASLRALQPTRLVTLIGAGGDRDRGKRPEMTRAAEKFSDVVYLTSDNPRSETPESIIAEMAAGILDNSKFHRNPDRHAAILEALQQAEPQDIILIAGKGHETYQEIKGVFHDFDDRQVALDWLRAAGYAS